MHAHLTAWDAPLHVAAGVTTVRDAGNANTALLELSAKIYTVLNIQAFGRKPRVRGLRIMQ